LEHIVDQGMRYRPGLFPCERCGHRADMHENADGVHRCRVCDYVALRLPCSSPRLREDAILASLSIDLDEPAR
jgi:hypothetical protein